MATGTGIEQLEQALENSTHKDDPVFRSMLELLKVQAKQIQELRTHNFWQTSDHKWTL